jgi:hypothetical protein
MHALAGATFGKVICNGNDIDEAIAMDQDGGSSLLATTPMLEMLEAASAVSPAVLRPFVAKVASETANRLKDSQLTMEGTISGAFTVIASFCRTGLNASRMSARSRGLLCSADAHEGVYAVLLWYEDGESPATPTRQTLRFYRAPFASKERAQSVYAQGEAAAIQYHYDTVEQHDERQNMFPRNELVRREGSRSYTQIYDIATEYFAGNLTINGADYDASAVLNRSTLPRWEAFKAGAFVYWGGAGGA